MSDALRTLLANAIDYAGLFPPASLSMDEAIAEYRRQRSGPAAWMVGTFVVPVDRLDELAAADLWDGNHDQPQRLSIIGRSGEDEDAWLAALEGDCAAIWAFIHDHRPYIAFASYEVRLPTHTGPKRKRGIVGVSLPSLAHQTGVASEAVFLEVPPLEDAAPIRQHVAQVAAQSACAKLRMGSADGNSVPSIASVAAMIDACRRRGVRWKATAGLHHALRSTAGGERHGFLNLLAATTLASAHDLSDHDLHDILGDENAEHFVFDNSGLRWRDLLASVIQIGTMRREGLKSFGSCSITEPWEELCELGLIESSSVM